MMRLAILTAGWQRAGTGGGEQRQRAGDAEQRGPEVEARNAPEQVEGVEEAQDQREQRREGASSAAAAARSSSEAGRIRWRWSDSGRKNQTNRWKTTAESPACAATRPAGGEPDGGDVAEEDQDQPALVPRAQEEDGDRAHEPEDEREERRRGDVRSFPDSCRMRTISVISGRRAGGARARSRRRRRRRAIDSVRSREYIVVRDPPDRQDLVATCRQRLRRRGTAGRRRPSSPCSG